MSKLLNLVEAAAVLRVSAWRLRQLVKEGRVRPCPITPGKLLFTEAELERFVAEAEGRPPTPEPATVERLTPA